MERLIRLATWNPRRLVGVAAACFLVAAIIGLPITGTLKSSTSDFQDPSSQFERTDSLIRRATGESPYYGVVVLLSGARDVLSPAAQTAIVGSAELLAHQRGFQSELDYPRTHSQELVSRDMRQTLVLAAFATPADSAAAALRVRRELERPTGPVRLAGMSALLGGPDVTFDELNKRTISDIGRAELIAFPIVFALSLWIFGSVVAALLPPLVGGFGIVVTLFVLRLIDPFTTISVFALNVVSGMGLGLGIDYSLFVLSRYREECADGAAPQLAIRRTIQTAGRTVLYSSITVAAALTSLLVFPIRFLRSMGIGGAVVALADGAVALMVLPALLLAIGPRINALSPGFLRRRVRRQAEADEEAAWARLARAVMRRPGPVAFVATVVLLVMAWPALRLHLAPPAADVLPTSAEANQVETALAENFVTNSAEGIELALRASPPLPIRPPSATRPASPSEPTSVGSLAAGAARMAGEPLTAIPTRYLGHDAWEVLVPVHGSPFSAQTQRLVARLQSLANSDRAVIGGWGAYFADQKAAIAAHIPAALVIMVALIGVCLFLMTGSLLLPVKGLLMTLLTAAVGAGLLVIIFQDGHLSSLLGFHPIGGLEESMLVLLFVITAALSTDYEIFLLGRIKEAYDQGLSNRDAVAFGLARTGRLITAAAILFCVAVGALVSSELFFTKQFGLGTALTVAIDATVVRALLVPSLMALLGDWNWWAPGPLRRLHRRIGLREWTATSSAAQFIREPSSEPGVTESGAQVPSMMASADPATARGDDAPRR